VAHRHQQPAEKWLGSEATVDINPFVAGVLTLGFIYGAYMTETFRGAILSIPKGQMEAAGPLAWVVCRPFCASPRRKWCATPCPGFTNNWLVLIKATALVSLIGLQEMTYAGQTGQRRHALAVCSFSCSPAALFLVYTSVRCGCSKRLNARLQPGHQAGATVNGLGSHF
jgi:arginine/ornithine transport system permease protein